MDGMGVIMSVLVMKPDASCVRVIQLPWCSTPFHQGVLNLTIQHPGVYLYVNVMVMVIHGLSRLCLLDSDVSFMRSPVNHRC